MRKILVVMLALCLLISPALALDAGSFVMNEKNYVDLDGDGGDETVILEFEGPEGEEYLALYLFGADGSFYTHEMPVMRLMDVFTRDIDGNGLQELFIVCDYYSDDYVTFCFNYDERGGMSVLQFSGLDRQGFGELYADSGYGRVTKVDGNIITLTGARDVLGTWMTSRDFIMLKGKFELIADLYRFETQDSDWEDRPLILKRELEVTLEDGSSAVLPVGEQLLPSASDAESIVHLVTRDGVQCSVEISENEENGWGFLVNGEKEEGVFEYIPYAD